MFRRAVGGLSGIEIGTQEPQDDRLAFFGRRSHVVKPQSDSMGTSMADLQSMIFG